MDTKKNLKTWLTLLLRIGFAALLLLASGHKILHPYDFAESVANYRVLGPDPARWVAVWLPYLEALVGLLLLTGLWLDAAALLNALLMTAFLLLVTQAYARGLDIRCGCYFFEGQTSLGLRKIIENLVLAGLSIPLLLLVSRKETHRSSVPKKTIPPRTKS